MSSSQILLLGAIAGFTIFLGLPIGRLRAPAPRLRALLNAVAIGILVFLLVETLGKSNQFVEEALNAAKEGKGTWLHFTAQGLIFMACLAVGLLSLVYYDRWMRRSRARSPRPFGPGAAAVGELGRHRLGSLSDARRLALFIALGIGFHNFAEGLAIGQSAAKDEISLALLLIIGFGLHNATEGFGIVAPLAAEREVPSWPFLMAMGLIGGGPTFLGTLVGQSYVSDQLFLAFLALAAGSILYVIIQLVKVAARLAQYEMLMWGVFLGVVLGFATDYVLVAAGA
jgi:ZIP family zinc transporter